MGVEPIPPLQAAARPKTSNLAVWSLVLGCLGLVLVAVCVGPVLAVAGVICGHLACKRIKASGGLLLGRGVARAGLIMSYVSIGLALIAIPFIMSVGLPGRGKPRETTPVSICAGNLRRIDLAKQSCAAEKKLAAEDMPSAGDLRPYLGQPLESLKCPEEGTYSINRIGEAPSCSVPGHVLPAYGRH